MEYLDGNQIIESVKEYIEHAPYDYAIMIDGEWGCGKSYLVKNELTEAIEQIQCNEKSAKNNDKDKAKCYEVISISLYGITDLATLSRQISTSIISSSGFANSGLGQVAKKVGPLAGAGLRLVADVFGRPISSDESAGDAVASFIQDIYNLKRFVFVFDDLERSSIPITEILGFISNLVEVNGVKVLIIANEKEIRDTLAHENAYRRLIDLASVSDKLILPEVKTIHQNLVQLVQAVGGHPKKEGTSLSIDQLTALADMLFPLDENYKRIKEKVVGQTLYFKPDLEQTIPSLIDNVFERLGYQYNGDIYNKEALANTILSAFNAEKHYNLRTVQMLLKYLCNLLPIAISVVSGRFAGENMFTLRQIVYGVSIVAIKFSKGKPYEEADYSNAQKGIYNNDSQQSYLSFKFTADYFYFGIFDKKYTRDFLEVITHRFWSDSNNPGNPLNKLRYFYEMTDAEVEPCLSELLGNFSQGKYEFNDYPAMLRILLDLCMIGMIEMSAVEEIVERMCENVRGQRLPSYSAEMVIGTQYKQQTDIYRRYLEKIKSAAKNYSSPTLQFMISKALDSGKLFSGEIESFYLQIDFSGNDQTSYFLLADIEKVLLAIKKSNAKEIMRFRLLLSGIYGAGDAYTALFPLSKKPIKTLLDSLSEAIRASEHQFYDKIAKSQADYLRNDLAELYAKYPTVTNEEAVRPDVDL